MTDPRSLLCQISIAIVLAGCAGQPITAPTRLKDAGRFTNEGVQAFSAADWRQAERLFGRALALYQGIDDQQGILLTYINLIEVALAIRDYQTAQRYLAHATPLVQSGELDKFRNRIRLLSANLAIQQHQFSEAERLLRPLLPEFPQSRSNFAPDPLQLAAIANRTRIAFAQQIDTVLWTQRYAAALKATESPAPELQGRLLRFQAALLQREGRNEDAADNLEQALARYKTALKQSGIAATLSELGQLYLQQRRWQAAQRYLRRAITVQAHSGDREGIMKNTAMLAQTEAALGNSERSRRIREWLAVFAKETPENRGSFAPEQDNPGFLFAD